MAAEAGLAAARTVAQTSRPDEEFSAFFELTYAQTLGLVTLVTGNRVLAEDATQEAYARAFDRWGAVAGMAHPDRWVGRVAINQAIDHRRRTAGETELTTTIEAAIPDSVEALWVRWNLDRLSPMQRAAVVCRYLEGRPVGEVAGTLGRSAQTVKTHLRLARWRLRAFLVEDG